MSTARDPRAPYGPLSVAVDWLTAPPVIIGYAMLTWVAVEVVGGVIGRSVPIPQIVWIRYAFHLLLMLALLGPPCRFRFVRTKRPGLQLTRSLLMLVMPMSFAFAVQTGRPGDVMGAFWIAPLLVLVLAPLIGDRGPRHAWITTLVAWIAATVLYHPPVASMGWSAVFAATMAASFSGYLVLTRELDRTEPVLTNLFYSAVGVFIVLSLWVPSYWVPVGRREILVGAAVAVVGWIALYLLDVAIRKESPSRLAPFLFIQVVLEVGLQEGRDIFVAPVVGPLFVIVGAIAAAFFIDRLRSTVGRADA